LDFSGSGRFEGVKQAGEMRKAGAGAIFEVFCFTLGQLR